MDSSVINKVKTVIGEETVAILNSVFQNCNGFPPSVSKLRFRADNPHWMETLDNIGTSGLLLTVDGEHKNYRVKAYSLPLINSSRAVHLLKLMEKAFSYFKEEYFHRLDSCTFTAEDISEALGSSVLDTLETLNYMIDVSGWWGGHSTEFPEDAGSTVLISESILKHESFFEMIMQVYGWHYINPTHTQVVDPFTERSIAYGGFFSPTESSPKPSWLETLDPVKKDLINEIDESLQKGLCALPAMGLRALIDLVIVEKIGDEGSFAQKLTGLVDKGYIPLQQKELINSVLEAGHAASHRAFFPESDDIRTCVDVIKHMMHAIYELQPRTELLNQKTPKRPKKKQAN